MAKRKGIEVWVGGTPGSFYNLWLKSWSPDYDPEVKDWWESGRLEHEPAKACAAHLHRAGCPHIPVGEKRLVRLVIEEVE